LKRPVAADDTVTVGKLRFDRRARRVTVDGNIITLTATELSLLSSLASEPGKTFKREELLKEVWETQVAGYARNVDCHITRLRNKLAKEGLPRQIIRTVHGVGYVLTDDPIPGLLDE
jgi:two-component system phosphate regulon response regulator PhoB